MILIKCFSLNWNVLCGSVALIIKVFAIGNLRLAKEEWHLDLSNLIIKSALTNTIKMFFACADRSSWFSANYNTQPNNKPPTNPSRENLLNPIVPSNVKDKRNLWFFGSVFLQQQQVEIIIINHIFFVGNLRKLLAHSPTRTNKKGKWENSIREEKERFGNPRGANTVLILH